ncbi:hypothetical protein CONPUDRAFT_79403 [Coniophora puteana RWD-64-598 SS2]|uniref:MARVEL domain-containing protein n=1 Tax=Coniophora puteana (strain RWD-64-598) TaxID=741705 RepID=A0A5M3N813_CONPW|nr:uncharacterized protein CONPUDRAFT_79403 [Coniophora puteana RWD-64-598 SS2]EIW87297.1 hypothetical protein CONPUDRAFT_79403 [Coniophora puteana RWD-64-598 SS2]
MAFDGHIRRGHPIIFGLLILFSIIELAITAWLTSMFNDFNNFFSFAERDRIRFLLFTSIWTLLFSFLLMGSFWRLPEHLFSSTGSHIFLLLLTWVFWTAGAASLTSALGGGLNCNTNTFIAYCGQLNAAEAFAWINWILVTIALFVVAGRGISGARRGDGIRGPLVV